MLESHGFFDGQILSWFLMTPWWWSPWCSKELFADLDFKKQYGLGAASWWQRPWYQWWSSYGNFEEEIVATKQSGLNHNGILLLFRGICGLTNHIYIYLCIYIYIDIGTYLQGMGKSLCIKPLEIRREWPDWPDMAWPLCEWHFEMTIHLIYIYNS